MGSQGARSDRLHHRCPRIDPLTTDRNTRRPTHRQMPVMPLRMRRSPFPAALAWALALPLSVLGTKNPGAFCWCQGGRTVNSVCVAVGRGLGVCQSKSKSVRQSDAGYHTISGAHATSTPRRTEVMKGEDDAAAAHPLVVLHSKGAPVPFELEFEPPGIRRRRGRRRVRGGEH